MHLRILVVEPQPERLLFLRDVFAELEAGPYWTKWVTLDVSYATTWHESSEVLNQAGVDVILLNLELDGMSSPEVFRQFQAAAPQIPVILLIDPSGIATAERLLRAGAQDYLVHDEIDCAPLARSIRNARERHLLLAAAQAGSTIDPLTGLLNRRAFESLTTRDRVLAQRLGVRMTLLLVEATSTDDVRIIEAADCLRATIHQGDLAAYLGDGFFGLSTIETDSESAEETCVRLRNAHGMRLGAAIIDPDEHAPLDDLLERAAIDIAPRAMAVRR